MSGPPSDPIFKVFRRKGCEEMDATDNFARKCENGPVVFLRVEIPRVPGQTENKEEIGTRLPGVVPPSDPICNGFRRKGR